jgi:hypothetical protein
MASATEAELAALFINAREAVYIRIILEELGHKQPPTPLRTDKPWQMLWSMEKFNPKEQKQWTCDSISKRQRMPTTI